MPKSYKHIIWDWNGTLFDDAWLCIDIMNTMLGQRNLPPLTPERYEIIFDFPVRDYYQKAGFDFSRIPFETLSDEFITAYYRRMPEVKLKDHALEALKQGQRQGVTMSILSAMEHGPLTGLVKQMGLSRYFVEVIGLNNHHAAGKVELAKQWMMSQPALDPAEILFIGDTIHDYEVAEALGVACRLIHSGHHSRKRLAVLGAPMIESLLDIY
jgi:phosphoglycolate phosphatase